MRTLSNKQKKGLKTLLTFYDGFRPNTYWGLSDTSGHFLEMKNSVIVETISRVLKNSAYDKLTRHWLNQFREKYYTLTRSK